MDFVIEAGNFTVFDSSPDRPKTVTLHGGLGKLFSSDDNIIKSSTQALILGVDESPTKTSQNIGIVVHGCGISRTSQNKITLWGLTLLLSLL
jgi:hypothetical protein